MKNGMRKLILTAIFTSLVSANAQTWTGWHPTAWGYYRNTSELVSVYATSHSFVLTNWTSATNPVITTNSFLSNIYAASNSGSYTSSFSFRLTDTNGNTVTETRTTTNFHTATNLYLSNREIMQFDIYRAVQERTAAVGGTNTARFYRDAYDNLVAAKDVISQGSTIGYTPNAIWFNPIAFSNIVPTNTGLQASEDSYIYSLNGDTNTDIANLFRIPSNYLSATYYRDIFGTNSIYKNVMTCTYTIATSSTNVVTNYLPTCCNSVGNPDYVYVIGTNRQVITVVCTNQQIKEGFTSADYGYRNMRVILTNLVAARFTEANVSQIYEGYNSSYPLFDTQPAQDSIDYAYDELINAAHGPINYNQVFTFAEGRSLDTESRALGRHGTNIFTWYHGQIGGNFDIYTYVTDAVTNGDFNDYGTGLLNTTNTAKLFTSMQSNYQFAVTSQVTLANWATTNNSKGFFIIEVTPIGWFKDYFKYK